MGQINDDLLINGSLRCTRFTPPVGCITDGSITSGAGVAYDKLTHYHHLKSVIAPATTITAYTELLHIANGAGTVQYLKAATVTAPTGDHTVTIDLKKSTGGGAFATVLSTPLVLNSSNVALTSVNALLSTATVVSGDLLEVIITVAGSTSSQGAGLIISVFVSELP